MPKPTVPQHPRPKKWPPCDLGYGGGTWDWDPRTGRYLLKHPLNGRRAVERGTDWVALITARDRARRDAEMTPRSEDTVATMLAHWLTFRAGVAPATRNTDEWAVGNVTTHLGDMPVRQLDATAISKMNLALSERLGTNSLTRVRSILRMACEFGVKHGYLTKRNLVDEATVPVRPVEPRKDLVCFDLNEHPIVRDWLVADGDNPRSAAFLAMMECGLRPAEALALRWAHVNLPGRVLHVGATIQRDGSKPGIYSEVLKTDRKNDCAHRDIPIPDALYGVLCRLHDRPRMQTRPRPDFVFAEGGTFLTFHVVELHARKIARGVGLARDVSPNGYRHTFASVCRSQGMPYEELAKFMGHASALQVIKTYGHPIGNLTAVDLNRYLGHDGRLRVVSP